MKQFEALTSDTIQPTAFTPRTAAEAKAIDPNRKWWLMVGFNAPKSRDEALAIVQDDLQRPPDRLEPVDQIPADGKTIVWCIGFLTGVERAEILTAHCKCNG
jgi:hypothetical protein